VGRTGGYFIDERDAVDTAEQTEGYTLLELLESRSDDDVAALDTDHKVFDMERLFDALIAASNLLPGIPEIYVDEPAVVQIRNGRNFPASPFRGPDPARYVKAITYQGELVAIGEAVLPNLYRPVVVL